MLIRLSKVIAALAAVLCLGVVLQPSILMASSFDGPRPLAQMRLDTWSLRDGLPAREISAIAQTPDGFIWLGTSAGLIRFDGSKFDVFNMVNTPSLPSNVIDALCVARDGSLWVGTDWGGFGRFSNGKFIRYELPNPQWTCVHTIVQAPDGSMWIGAWGDEPLRHVTGTHDILYKWLDSTDPGVNAILPLSNGSVVCGMPWDTPRIMHPDGTTSKIWADHKFPYPCMALLRGNDGSIWYATGRSGVIRIKNGRYQTYTERDGLPSNLITSLYQDRDGRILIGTRNGLCVWNGSSVESFGKIDGLFDSYVNSIYQDAEGSIWVGSGIGLNRFATTKLVPFSITQGSTSASGSKVATDQLGNGVWCATSLGLWHLDTGLPVRDKYMDKWESHFEGVSTSTTGHLWAWTDHSHGQFDIYDVTLKSGQTSEFDTDLAAADGQNALACTFTKSAISIDTATAVGDSLIGFGNHEVFEYKSGKCVLSQPFANGYVFCARADSTGTVWTGGTNGLESWRNGVTKTYSAGLPANSHVLSVDVTDPNSIWMATDHGLGWFHNGQISVFGAAAGLPDTNLFQVLTDRQGRVWLGSNFGIFSLRISDIQEYADRKLAKIPYYAFGPADGIRSFPSGFSCASSLDGNFWFCGPVGVTDVDPASNAYNRVAPPVAIEDASLDGTPLSPTEETQVNPGPGRLSIDFAALSFQAPEKVQFKYKLEGMDTTWTDGGNSRSVYYPYLAPGTYRFVVIACNNDGVWNRIGASVPFVLLPHYYETGWFKIACALVAAVLLAGIYYIRVRTIVQHSRELEHKVAERTEEVVESNSQLQSAQEALALQYQELADRNAELESMQQELRAHNEELFETREILARANAHLEALATTDGLTGLKNHRSFQEQLEAEWERFSRYGRPLSIIMLDVDRFKQYNDTFGHPGGDEVLKRVSNILTGIARESDFVARYGGEEFVIIVPESDEEGATILAERMRVAIEHADWTLRSVTASFGVAAASVAQDSGSDLLALSDAALFRSKAQGRNRVTSASTLEPAVDVIRA